MKCGGGALPLCGCGVKESRMKVPHGVQGQSPSSGSGGLCPSEADKMLNLLYIC